jgi:transcriptional regulator with XRE-family HTH domain
MQAFFYRQGYVSGMSNSPTRAIKFRTLREATGLSQRELARQLGVHHSNLSYWERTGNLPGSDLLPQLAKILGVDVAQLLGESARAKHIAAPSGRARLAFDAVSKLPKRQQQKIVEVVQAFVAQYGNGHKQAA